MSKERKRTSVANKQRRGKGKTKRSYPNPRQPASVFSFLERDFADIILEIREGGADGRPSTKNCARKTIIFRNDTKLYVIEYKTSDGWIDYYYYDWVTSDGKTILKWHSEPHNADERYQTTTEPYHIHLPASETLHNMYRLANFEHQTLRSIIEFILLFDKALPSFQNYTTKKP
ncbi:toxin-antitoxin system TumE family protein [Anoxybacillus eryuanensis]|uniref:toxin-antitoxin system TumE family protein n=1 Tax=Anoxybacillus eryuanensis TaxID=651866 RepID=UPI003EF511B3